MLAFLAFRALVPLPMQLCSCVMRAVLRFVVDPASMPTADANMQSKAAEA